MEHALPVFGRVLWLEVGTRGGNFCNLRGDDVPNYGEMRDEKNLVGY